MTSALLIMDVQTFIVERFEPVVGPVLDALARAARAARASGVPVVHVRIGFRPGAPEVSARNSVFASLARSEGMGVDDPRTQVHPSLVADGDVVVVKKRTSAFTGSDLDVVLRSLGAESLVLTGIATSGVVLSTLRQAADLDYRLTVLRDGCLDNDDEVHRVLLEKIFPRHATVLQADEWIAGLGPVAGA